MPSTSVMKPPISAGLVGQPAAVIDEFLSNAHSGQLWTLTPYVTLRMAHAVRLPAYAPNFRNLTVATRGINSTKANIYDELFAVDGASTGSIDVEATWTDPIDDPTDPNNDPANSTTTTVAKAFKLSVPDPNPPPAVDAPGMVQPAPETLQLKVPAGVTHDLHDTKYHSVSYQATGQSRFAEFFRSPIPIAVYVNLYYPIEPIVISQNYGLDPSSVIVEDSHGVEVKSSYYSVDPVAGTITFSADAIDSTNESLNNQYVTVSFIPTITRTGDPTTVPVLSTARPKPPKIIRVVPSWQINTSKYPSGKTIYTRQGNFLRVYLDRPWWTSGANELLGVVTAPDGMLVPIPLGDPQDRVMTQMGLDPISVPNPSLFFPSSPASLEGTTTLPASIPGRQFPYSNPALINPPEDQDNVYRIWPYEVVYDYDFNQWFADIQFNFNDNDPPPGYFIKLALVRFQPYSEEGVELSPVALATFAQPVSSRAVVVIPDETTNIVTVYVTGPAYQGFRPLIGPAADIPPFDFPTPTPSDAHGGVYDRLNSFAQKPYSPDVGLGNEVTSTMVVDVQVNNANLGLPIGDLTWQSYGATAPVVLEPLFDNGLVTWTGQIQMPNQIGGDVTQRVRISEIDYYTGDGAPTEIDTTLRRPFICHIEV